MEIFSLFSSLSSLLVLGAILYFIFRPREGQAHGKDTYFYVVSFVVLMVLTWAVTDLLRIMLEQILGVGDSVYSYSRTSSSSQAELLRRVSLRLSTLVVALPIWAFHWYKVSMKKKEEIDVHSRKSYALAMMVITTLWVIGTGTGLVYLGFNAMLGVGENANRAIPYLLPYSMAGVILWVSHYQVWRRIKEEAGQPIV